MTWVIKSFETKRGEKTVEEFVKNLDEATIAKFVHSIDLLEKHGSFLGIPHVKKLTSDLLYELASQGLTLHRVRPCRGDKKSH